MSDDAKCYDDAKCFKVGHTTVVIRNGRVTLSEDWSWEGLQVVPMSLEEFAQIARWVAEQQESPS